jgi:phosphoribosylanthranilate isomerase
MTWIKICGTTNLEDALTAVDAGADALGFVFYEKSPRKIDLESARDIVRRLPPEIEKVGVFVDEPVEKILKTVAEAGLTAAQLHGPEARKPEFIEALKMDRGLKLFLVVPAAEINGSQENIKGESGISAVFFDSGTPQQPGGTGRTFDWEKTASRIETIRKRVKVVVAGGLNSSNVADAIRILKPWGVDVVSGVEAGPGKKDPRKVRAFIDAVRTTGARNNAPTMKEKS